MSYITPRDEQFQAFQEAFHETEPVTMLNLLRFREVADYADHPNEAPCSGREAFSRYVDHVTPIIESCGAQFIFSESARTTVIGPEEENWDEVILVTYPNCQTMGGMMMSSEYQAIAHHRTAAIEDSRLISMDAPNPKG